MRDIIVPHTQAAPNGDIATMRRQVIKGHVDMNVTDEVGVSNVLVNVTGGHHSGRVQLVFIQFVMVPCSL